MNDITRASRLAGAAILTAASCAWAGEMGASVVASGEATAAPVTATLSAEAPAALGASVTITLRGEARVRGRWILLGDIADLAGVPEARRMAIAALQLGRAPMAGATRRLEAADVTRRLAAAGLDGVTVSPVGGAVLVSAAVRAVPGDDLVRCGRAFLETQAVRPGTTVRIEDPAMPRSLTVPDGDVELKASVGERRLAGLVPVTVETLVDGERVARTLLTFRVKATGRGLKAARALAAGETVSAADVVEADLDLASVADNVLTDAGALGGLRILRPVAEGQWIRRGAVAQALQVHRGKQVTLMAKIGSVEARAPAQSREDGAAGEVITVVNLNSKRSLRARVTGPDTVEAVMP